MTKQVQSQVSQPFGFGKCEPLCALDFCSEKFPQWSPNLSWIAQTTTQFKIIENRRVGFKVCTGGGGIILKISLVPVKVLASDSWSAS